MDKLGILGGIFATAPLWGGLLCATLEVCFKIDSHVILMVAVSLVGISLLGLGVCSWKSID